MQVYTARYQAVQRCSGSFARSGRQSSASRRVQQVHRPGLHQPARATRPTVASSPVVQEDVELPLEIHHLLRISQAASRETCKRVVEQLSSSPPAVGFTQETLAARERVLSLVGSSLTQGGASRATGQPTSIPYSDIPGALALLHEAGDLQIVLSWGEAWLGQHPDSRQAQDAALALALAHCDLAGARMDSSTADVLSCTEEMQAADALLKQYNTGPVLRQDIHSALQELAPQTVLSQLALALDHPMRHSRGLLGLQRILWRQGQPVWEFPALHMDRSTYLQEAFRHMTASEQVELFESAPEGAPVPEDELYQIVLAHIVHGMHTFSAAHVATADKMLAFLTSPPRGEGDREVSVEVAACKLLLGDVAAAEAALGLGPNAQHAPDPEIQGFIQEHCAESEDLLPGLVAMAQQWLSDVVYPSFRGGADACIPLQRWFDHPRVSLQLKVRQKAQDLGLHEARTNLSAAAQKVTGAVASKLSALWEGSPMHTSHPLVQTLQEVSPEQLASAAALVADPIPAPAAPASRPAAGQDKTLRKTKQMQELEDAMDQEASIDFAEVQEETVGSLHKRLAGIGAAPGDQSAGQAGEGAQPAAAAAPSAAAAPQESGAASPGQAPMASKGRQLRQAAEAPVLSSSALAAGIRPFAGEREMWSAVSPATLRRRRMRSWLAGVWLVGISIFAICQWRTRAALPSTQGPAWSFTQPFWQASPAKGDQITQRQAVQIVQDWQKAKAEALGLKHDAELLKASLSGPVLDQWLDATNSLKEQQRHWELALQSVEVTAVDVTVPNESARLRATVQESAKLLDHEGATEEAYEHPVTIDYELTWQNGLGWRIVNFDKLQ